MKTPWQSLTSLSFFFFSNHSRKRACKTNPTVHELLSNNTGWDDLTQPQKDKARDVKWNKSSRKRELEKRTLTVQLDAAEKEIERLKLEFETIKDNTKSGEFRDANEEDEEAMVPCSVSEKARKGSGIEILSPEMLV